METTVLYSLTSVLVVSLVSLIGVFTLSFRESFLRASIFFLVSLAVGALLGDAIIHLIPEAIEEFGGNAPQAALWVLMGFLVFFILEKFLRWHHAHGLEDTHGDPESVVAAHGRVKPVGPLVLVSDGFHNFIDGVIIAASYAISIELGIATTIAVILHEIPQEIGDFGVLIHAGFTKTRALLMNFLSALLAVAGAAAFILLEGTHESLLPALLGISAGSFIYIAGSDLVPELQQNNVSLKRSVGQLGAVVIGMALMFALLALE